jgi:hypothetical protein
MSALAPDDRERAASQCTKRGNDNGEGGRRWPGTRVRRAGIVMHRWLCDLGLAGRRRRR